MSDFVIRHGFLDRYNGPGGDIVIPEEVTDFTPYCGVGLRQCTGITFPSGVTNIDYKLFSDTELGVVEGWGEKLVRFDVHPGNQKFSSRDGVLYSKDGKKLLLFPPAKASYSVPKGVTQIAAGAFFAAMGLRELTLPESVKSIAADGIRFTGLEFLRLPKAVTKLAKHAVDVPYVAFYHAAIAERMEYPVYLGGPLDDLPPKCKNSAVKGFLYARAHGITEINAFRQSYADHVRKNPDSYLRNAESDDTLLLWLMEDGLIPQKAFEKILAKRKKTASAECMAAMLAYQQKHFGTAGDDHLTLEDTPENKKASALAARREEARNQKGIAGLTFVATGYLNHFGIYAEYAKGKDLDDLKRYIEERGGKLRSSVSTKTDYLICNDPASDSVKSRKAEDLGIPVITEDDFLKLCETT